MKIGNRFFLCISSKKNEEISLALPRKLRTIFAMSRKSIG